MARKTKASASTHGKILRVKFNSRDKRISESFARLDTLSPHEMREAERALKEIERQIYDGTFEYASTMAKLDMSGRVAHSIRHHFAAKLLSIGAPIAFVSAIMGYTSQSIVWKNYTKWLPEVDKCQTTKLLREALKCRTTIIPSQISKGIT